MESNGKMEPNVKMEPNGVTTKKEEDIINEIYINIKKVLLSIANDHQETELYMVNGLSYPYKELTIKDREIFKDNMKFYNSIYEEIMSFSSLYFSKKFDIKKKRMYKCFEFFVYILNSRNYTFDDDNLKASLICLVDELYHIAKIQTIQTEFDNINIILSFLDFTETDFDNLSFMKVIKSQCEQIDELKKQSIIETINQRKKELQQLKNIVSNKIVKEYSEMTEKDESDPRKKTIAEYKINLNNFPRDVKYTYQSFTMVGIQNIISDLNKFNQNAPFDIYNKYPELFPIIDDLESQKKRKNALILSYYFNYEYLSLSFLQNIPTQIIMSQTVYYYNLHDISKNQDFLTLFTNILFSPLVRGFFEHSFHGQKCLPAYNNLKKEYQDKMQDFFRKTFIFTNLPDIKQALTLRYSVIFINELHYSYDNCYEAGEKEKLRIAFFIIVLLNELTNYLFKLEHPEELSTINNNKKEGGKLMQEYLLGLYEINTINIEQAKAILNINNWDSEEKTTIKDKFTTNNNESQEEMPIIKFMNSKLKKVDWCGATFP